MLNPADITRRLFKHKLFKSSLFVRKFTFLTHTHTHSGLILSLGGNKHLVQNRLCSQGLLTFQTDETAGLRCFATLTIV